MMLDTTTQSDEFIRRYVAGVKAVRAAFVEMLTKAELVRIRDVINPIDEVLKTVPEKYK